MHKSFWCLCLGSTAGKLWDAVQQNWRRKNLSACIWWTESSVWKRRTGSQMLLCCRQDWTLSLTYSVWQGKQLWSKLGLGFCICNWWCLVFFLLPPGGCGGEPPMCSSSHMNEESWGMIENNSGFPSFGKVEGCSLGDACFLSGVCRNRIKWKIVIIMALVKTTNVNQRTLLALWPVVVLSC